MKPRRKLLRLTASVIEVLPCAFAQWHRCTRPTNAAIGDALKAA
jgi:hypothetical protein